MKLLNINKSLLIIIIGSLTISISSCKKLIEIEGPIDKISEQTVFESDAKAIAAMTAIYYNLAQYTTIWTLSLGLSADEFVLNDADWEYGTIYTNSIQASDNMPIWSISFDNIYRINTFIEGVTASNRVSQLVKDQLIGEAKFVRAFLNFYLVNIYGKIPLLLTSNYKANSTVSRTSIDSVYNQITNDLLNAKSLLKDYYVEKDVISQSSERVRPNKYTAAALLARVFLFMEKWGDAEDQASFVIANNSLFALESVEGVFTKSSQEAIWQLQPVIPLQQTNEARLFILTTGPSYEKPVTISNFLYGKFESDDKRLQKWIGTDSSNAIVNHFVYKYKVEDPNEPIVEYSVIIRLAEMYLVRAEARIRIGRFTGPNGGDADINLVRMRAGLSPITLTSLDGSLSIIEKERQVELFAEWGHRWLDLKRLNQLDNYMSNVSKSKGGSWESTDKLYPIPALDIQRNQNLAPQNEGY